VVGAVARLVLLELITLLALVVVLAVVQLHITVPIALAALVQLIKVTLAETQIFHLMNMLVLAEVAQEQLVRQT
jgi:hypothetical protein